MARFQRFKKITDTKAAWDQTIGHIAGAPRWTARLPWKTPALAVHHVAIDLYIPRPDLPALVGVAEYCGPQRCSGADLLIVGCMNYMQGLPRCVVSIDGQRSRMVQACDIILVIGLGLPVIAASSWRIAGGNPKNLNNASVIFHKAAATIKK